MMASMNDGREENGIGRPGDPFATTQWSLVLRAGGGAGAGADAALALLCQRYWPPLYGYVRRRVPDVESAQDLTQEFFVRLLEKNALAAADPQRGRFRAFLLTAMKNFLENARDHDRAQKRGGGRRPISLDWEQGESRLRIEPISTDTPERIFEREWTHRLLELVLDRLSAEYARSGKGALFGRLAGFLADAGAGYAGAAADLGMTEPAVRQAVHRLRKRYRALLRDEVARTLGDPADVDAELRSLFAALGP